MSWAHIFLQHACFLWYAVDWMVRLNIWVLGVRVCGLMVYLAAGSWCTLTFGPFYSKNEISQVCRNHSSFSDGWWEEWSVGVEMRSICRIPDMPIQICRVLHLYTCAVSSYVLMITLFFEAVPVTTEEQTAPFLANLNEMGFCDRQLNIRLLQKHNCDMAQVVTELLQLNNSDWYRNLYWAMFVLLIKDLRSIWHQQLPALSWSSREEVA